MNTFKRTGMLLAAIISIMSIQAQQIAGIGKHPFGAGRRFGTDFSFCGRRRELTGTMDVPMQGASGIPVDG